MAVLMEETGVDLKLPVNVVNRHFIENKRAYYRWLREEDPVHKGKLTVIPAYFVSRHEDCVSLLKDPRFVRNRSTAKGGGRRSPFPMPKSVAAFASSMIVSDDPDHGRLRGLVQQAFTRGALAKMESRIETLTHELLDVAEKQGTVDLTEAYSLPIPVTVIREMMGVSDEDMPKFRDSLTALTKGMSGWNVAKTLFWDLGRVRKFVQDLIARKRQDPGDDILTALIHAEEAGDRLTEDELVGLTFLLIIAGYETTVHLISNGVLALLQNPDQLERLHTEPELMESAVEEVLRYDGPIHGTKPNYATEDVEWHGVTIPKGAMAVPLLGSANFDPRVFDDPDTLDIARSPNPHLAFGYGAHFCLGAPLARMEARIAFKTLIERNPNLRLAVDPSELKIQRVPLWHRYESLPVALG